MKKEKKLARFVYFTFRYIDDVLSLNNCTHGDYVHPIDLAIKDSIDSYLDLRSELTVMEVKNEILLQKT